MQNLESAHTDPFRLRNKRRTEAVDPSFMEGVFSHNDRGHRIIDLNKSYENQNLPHLLDVKEEPPKQKEQQSFKKAFNQSRLSHNNVALSPLSNLQRPTNYNT
jgi:hypothetical protein